jgi:hypothetical protein
MVPSRIRCESGLFVGVDRFASQPRQQWLNAPGEDASNLADYFNRALPGDSWRVLKRSTRSGPSLINVLKGLNQLVASVRVGRAGVFYYAGHAEVTDSGLVLKTADCHDQFPSDTGLRLSRVLRLFKSEKQKYFLLILDCCRSGSAEAAAVDDIPPNCCVVYACQHGEVALETTGGGVLTRSLIDTFDFYTQRKAARECPLDFVVSNLHRQIFSWRPLGALSYDVCGNLVDRLVLPLPDGREHATWDTDLNLVVKYRFGDRADFQRAFVSVVKLLAEWHALPLSSRAAKEYIDEQLGYDGRALAEESDGGGELYLDVKVPLSADHRKPSALLANILEHVRTDDPETVTIRWPRSLKPAIFQVLKHTVEGGEWAQASPRGDYALRWRSESSGKQFRGSAWVENDDASTRVVIGCETLDAVPVRTKFLLPRLTDLVDLMLAIRT